MGICIHPASVSRLRAVCKAGSRESLAVAVGFRHADIHFPNPVNTELTKPSIVFGVNEDPVNSGSWRSCLIEGIFACLGI